MSLEWIAVEKKTFKRRNFLSWPHAAGSYGIDSKLSRLTNSEYNLRRKKKKKRKESPINS